MIGIKKVQVVPLDENYGKIVDSFNTQDNKHNNAPSLNAVEVYADTKYKLKGDFAIITFNNVTNVPGQPALIQLSADLPEGFTWDNCHLISAEYSNADGSFLCSFPHTTLFDYESGQLIAGCIRLITYQNSNSFAIRGNGPLLYGETETNLTIRVILMKI